MDPNHRDRVAFVRLCSGRFRRGMKLFNVREKKPMNVAAPIFFFAQQRETIDEAFPGDIIGIPNHGTLHVGDTLTEGEALRFTGIPNFAPEILRRVVLEDGCKRQAAQQGAERSGRRGRGADLPSASTEAGRSSARSVRCSSRCWPRGSRPNTGSRCGWKPRLTKPRAGSRATSPKSCSASAMRTVPASPRTGIRRAGVSCPQCLDLAANDRGMAGYSLSECA